VFSVLRCLCSVLGCFSEFSGVCVGVICFLRGLGFITLYFGGGFVFVLFACLRCVAVCFVGLLIVCVCLS